MGYSAHRIVGNSCGYGTAYPGWVREKGIKTAIAAVIEIDIYSAIEGQNEITDCVGPLNGEGILVESFEEPGVFCFDEFAGFIVRPELYTISCSLSLSRLMLHSNITYSIIVVSVQIDARLLTSLPSRGYRLIDVRLMYDLGY